MPFYTVTSVTLSRLNSSNANDVTEYFQNIFGTFLGHFGNIFGIFEEYFEDIFGISLGYLWDIFGRSVPPEFLRSFFLRLGRWLRNSTRKETGKPFLSLGSQVGFKIEKKVKR